MPVVHLIEFGERTHVLQQFAHTLTPRNRDAASNGEGEYWATFQYFWIWSLFFGKKVVILQTQLTKEIAYDIFKH